MVSKLTMVINLVLPAAGGLFMDMLAVFAVYFETLNACLVSFASVSILTVSSDAADFNMLL
jgi:hypothetical protein